MGKEILLKMVFDSDSARILERLRFKHGPSIESVIKKAIDTQYFIDELLAKKPGQSLFVGVLGDKLRKVTFPM